MWHAHGWLRVWSVHLWKECTFCVPSGCRSFGCLVDDGVILWPRRRSYVMMLHFNVLPLSPPAPIPPSLCHQPRSWVMSHDTRTEIPSISHSDTPLSLQAEACACVWAWKGEDLEGRLSFQTLKMDGSEGEEGEEGPLNAYTSGYVLATQWKIFPQQTEREACCQCFTPERQVQMRYRTTSQSQ